MKSKIASRMDRLMTSGIRKVNEKALAMERAGEEVLHFEIGRPDFDTPEYIKRAAEESIDAGDVFYNPARDGIEDGRIQGLSSAFGTRVHRCFQEVRPGAGPQSSAVAAP